MLDIVIIIFYPLVHSVAIRLLRHFGFELTFLSKKSEYASARNGLFDKESLFAPQDHKARNDPIQIVLRSASQFSCGNLKLE